jgi:hypothetical protein
VSAPNAPTRRQFLHLLSLLASGRVLAAETGKPSGDNGLGGTGYKPGDNGIGGTGFIGTIRKFGSVYVNGERISYPADVRIEIDGVSATPRQMRIGQVARLVAERSAQTWTTNGIVIVNEVVGRIDRINGRRLDILGQSVELTRAKMARSFSAGDRVAISGLRRPDQTIVASLIERREGGPDQIAGVLGQNPHGDFVIGGQRIAGVGAALVGERIVTRGGLENGAFVARTVKLESPSGLSGARNVSIETWLTLRDGAAVTANGVRVEDQAGGLQQGSYLAVIRGEMKSDGLLIARQVELPNGRGGFDPPGPRGGPRGGGGPGGGMNGPGGFPGPSGPGGGMNGPGGLPGPGGARLGGTNAPGGFVSPGASPFPVPSGGAAGGLPGPGGFGGLPAPGGLGGLPAPGGFGGFFGGPGFRGPSR